MTQPVWVVASGAAAERWTHALRLARGAVESLPWSEIRPVGDPATVRETLEQVGPDLVLLTSPNGLRLLPGGVGEGFEAACVGTLTASLARGLGFSVELAGRGTGGDLARELITAGEPGLILFLRGEAVRREGPDLLEAAGWRIEERVIYEACPRPAFDGEVAAASEPSAFVVGSPNAASALARALELAGRGAWRERPAVAIGATTAGRLEALAFRDVVVAEESSLQGIQRALGHVFGRDPSA